jgi:hypothetical protein
MQRSYAFNEDMEYCLLPCLLTEWCSSQIRRDFQLLQLLGLPELIETFIQFVTPEKQATATAKTGSLFPGSRGTEAKQRDRISVQRRLLGTARLLQQVSSAELLNVKGQSICSNIELIYAKQMD